MRVKALVLENKVIFVFTILFMSWGSKFISETTNWDSWAFQKVTWHPFSFTIKSVFEENRLSHIWLLENIQKINIKDNNFLNLVYCAKYKRKFNIIKISLKKICVFKLFNFWREEEKLVEMNWKKYAKAIF